MCVCVCVVLDGKSETPPRATFLSCQICATLPGWHARSIVHRYVCSLTHSVAREGAVVDAVHRCCSLTRSVAREGAVVDAVHRCCSLTVALQTEMQLRAVGISLLFEYCLCTVRPENCGHWEWLCVVGYSVLISYTIFDWQSKLLFPWPMREQPLWNRHNEVAF